MSKVIRFCCLAAQACIAEDLGCYVPDPELAEYIRSLGQRHTSGVVQGGTLEKMAKKSHRRARFLRNAHGKRGRKRWRPKGAVTIRRRQA